MLPPEHAESLLQSSDSDHGHGFNEEDRSLFELVASFCMLVHLNDHRLPAAVFPDFARSAANDERLAQNTGGCT